MITFSPEWLKKNWLWLSFWIGLAILIIGLMGYVRSCDDAVYKEKIEGLDKDISDLKKANVKLEGEVVDYINDALAGKERVEKLEAEIAGSKSRIEDLEKEEIIVEEIVMELPPSRLVEELQVVLECREILLNEDGILFPVECARQGLLKLRKFSLVEGKYDEAILALSKSEKALVLQKRVSWNLFGALWKMGDQIINYKAMAKSLDIKFNEAEKQNKKRFLSGLWKGFVIGVIAGVVITATFKFVIK